MLAGGNQPGGVGVSQVMEPAWLAHSLRHCLAPDPAEGSPPQERPSFGGRHHPVDQRVSVDVKYDRVQGDSREGDGALRCRRLWSTQTWSFCSCLDERRSNGEPAAQHVDGSDPEPGELSPAKTGVGGDTTFPIPGYNEHLDSPHISAPRRACVLDERGHDFVERVCVLLRRHGGDRRCDRIPLGRFPSWVSAGGSGPRGLLRS